MSEMQPRACERIAVDVVMPVHNEVEGIEDVLREWTDMGVAHSIDVRIVVSEDGSDDGTPELLDRLQASYPLLALTGGPRKGYSQAVIDGIRASDAPWVCCVDSDGQCDPADLPRLLAVRDSGDVIKGVRSPRNDTLARKVMSGAFKTVYGDLIGVHLKDPSCPYVVMSGSTARKIAEDAGVLLPQGYWWEFHARRKRLGFTVFEVPVAHRVRASGATRVYRPSRVPRIAAVHLRGLLQLRRETRT
jgi:dolichol-phosphate mannosyltransferase